MKNRPEQIKKFLEEQIPDHPRDVVTLAMREFGVTRPTVLRHLDKLIREGKVLKTGRTSDVLYHLATDFNKKLKFKIEPGLAEYEVWKNYLDTSFQSFKSNIYEISRYGFTEIFNNAIDHSGGSEIEVLTKLEKNSIVIKIKDDGVGIFKKIRKAFNLGSERDSVLQLAKGKLTTDPEHHTGEGIFFTSRAVDEFFIWSYDLDYFRDNRDEDWFLLNREDTIPGTWVSLTISINSTKSLDDIFKTFTTEDSEEGIRRFDKTHFKVALGTLGEEHYISRSQAKRLVVGLDRFQEVVLDFKDVKTVGQGFVDEVFRIFQNRHPHIKIRYTNANENVEFMIKRGLPEQPANKG